MSRSAELLVVGAVLVTGLVAAPALADDATARHIWAPTALPSASELTPQVFPLIGVSTDQRGLASVTTAPTKVDVIVDSNIGFGKDSAVLTPAARQRLAQIAALLKQKGPGRIDVLGYTDDLGSAEHGLTLSQQRAEAVREVLAPALAGYSINVTGRGEADPLVPNTSEANRARNRRVEIHYVSKG